ncbi:MAG: endonuclease/exonuclease/phosphatase family protein [bacterium]
MIERCLYPLLGLFLGGLLGGCPAEPKREHATPPTRSAADMELSRATPSAQVVLRAHSRLGVPLHPLPRSRKISGRLPGGSVVRILAERFDGRWVQIRAQDGTTGWIVRRYLGARLGTTPRSRVRPEDGAGCRAPAPGPAPQLRVTEVAQPVRAGKGPPLGVWQGPLVVASYNVWELYDGKGGDRYLSRHHAGTLAAPDVEKRVTLLAEQLRGAMPHVIAFQEIENARLACRIAAKVVPRAPWRCAAGSWSRGASPQNVAIASRVGGGRFRVLTPLGRFIPRGAVELELGGGKLRILSVHMKSSRGARGARDCRNAAKRQALARALIHHLQASRATSAALVLGDYNFDPLQALHDRTDDELRGARFVSLRQQFYPKGAPSTFPRYKSTIDLAFFRAAAGIRAAGFRVLQQARSDRWVSDHLPVAATLRLR